MNENSYLNPEAIRAQCDAAISQLEKDNEAFCREEKSIQAFIDDESIKSVAFDALKQQMNDYITVLQTLRLANDAYIKDYRFQKVAAGTHELRGSTILGWKEYARKEKIRNEEKAEQYRKKARQADSELIRMTYRIKVEHYEAMAELEQKFHDAWQEEEDLYDAIERITCGLFEEGKSIRAIAENALASLQGTFHDGAYHPDMNARWRADIYDIYFNRVFTVSENGELKMDMEKVEEMLKKDAGEITAEEYDVIALAYLLADIEELPVFMQSMLGERTDYNTSWYTSGMNYKFYSEWGVDGEKVNQIKTRLGAYAEAELKVMHEFRTIGDNDAARDMAIQRGDILQRITLLDVISVTGVFGGEYEAEKPKITITQGENGELVLEFCEGKITNGSKPEGSTLRDSSIVISDTVIGVNIGLIQSNYTEYVLVSHFGSYSLGEDMGKFVVNKAKGKVKINPQFVRNLSNRIGQIPGKERLGEVIGYIPVVGDAVKFGMDTVKKKEEAEQNVKFIEGEMENINVAMLYSGFDCCVNFVDYNTAENNSHEFCPYKGEQTDSKIAQFNNREELVEAFSRELTEEIMLGNPEEVVEFWQKIQSNEEYGLNFEAILSNKYVE